MSITNHDLGSKIEIEITDSSGNKIEKSRETWVVDEVNEKKEFECSALQSCIIFLLASLILSFSWLKYSMAFEVLPLEDNLLQCSKTIRNEPNTTSCYKTIQGLKDNTSVESTFWALIIISAILPWISWFMFSFIATHENTTKKNKENFELLSKMLILMYVVILILGIFIGRHVFFNGTPVFIGLPMVFIIPFCTYYIVTLNNIEFIVNIPIKVIYYIIVITTIITSSYIIQEPTTNLDAYYKGINLVRCGYVYAIITAIIISGSTFCLVIYEDKDIKLTLSKAFALLNIFTFNIWFAVTNRSANKSMLVIITVLPFIMGLIHKIKYLSIENNGRNVR